MNLTKSKSAWKLERATAMNNKGQVVGRDEFGARIWRAGQVQPIASPDGAGGFGEASAINDDGSVVGLCTFGAEHEMWHGFLWKAGKVKDLGTLGGDYCEANAINNKGQVVGRSSITTDRPLFAYLWEDGEMTNLGALPGDKESTAVAVNNDGDISATRARRCRGFRRETDGPSCGAVEAWWTSTP